MKKQLVLSAAWVLSGLANAASADWKPSAQVEYLVPAGAGGAVDTYARVMKQVFDTSGALAGQNFLISNKPGGDGLIAMSPLTQHKGNAHWMSMLSSGFLLRQAQGGYKYDIPKDFSIGPILFEETLGVAVREDSPLRSAQDLVEHLRKDPSAIRIAVAPSLYNHIHVGLLQPLEKAGVATNKLTVAAFRSSAESVTALLGGHVDVVSASVPNLVAGLKAGNLRVLAVTSKDRLKGTLAKAPTWREQGVDSVFTSVQGIIFPKELTSEQLRFWDRQFDALSRSSQWQQALEQYDATPYFLNHEQARRYVSQELESMTEIMRNKGQRK